MKKLSLAAFNKLVKKVAYRSRPHYVGVNYSFNSVGCLAWHVSIQDVEEKKITMISHFDIDAVKKLKLAAQRGVVPGEEVKV